MKTFRLSTFFGITILIVWMNIQPVLAQKATAELIAKIEPPKTTVEYRDGARQVTIAGDLLFITNFWAGLQVLDISDISAPKQLATFASEDEAYSTAISGNRAYLANHSSGIVVFDFSDPANIQQVEKIKLPGNAYNVTADERMLYVAMGDSGIAMIDIQSEATPEIERFRIPGVWVQHVAVNETHLFVSAKMGGFMIFELPNSGTAQPVGTLRTGYNTMMVQLEDDLAYLAEGKGGLSIMNIADPANPVLLSRFRKSGFVGSIRKSGSYAYLANRESGLMIVNVSDPEKPFLEGQYVTPDICYGVTKRDVYVFIAANQETNILRHNNAPQLSDVKDAQLSENQRFTLNLEATEPDGDAFEYQAFNLPEGAEFAAETGTFSWTPGFEQSGTYPGIIFRVLEHTESALSVSDTITLKVAHVNRLPDLPRPADATVAENTLLTFTVEAGSDPDAEDQNRLSYRAEKLPQGAMFDPATRTFSWTPTYEQSGEYIVDFLMDDGAGGIDREPVTITVTHVDRKPAIVAISDQSIPENALLTLQIEGTDPDSEDQNAIRFVMENLPEGASFDAASRTFSWTPTFDQSGSYPGIRAIMIAGAMSDTSIFNISVAHVNRTPLLDEIMAQEVAENQTLTFSISGSDPDVEDNGKLVFSATNLPAGAAFDAATRTFSWTPTYEQSGTYDVQFRISDPAGLSDTKTVSVAVQHVNRAPSIAAVSAKTVNENTALPFTLTASDPDREDTGKLRFSALSLPEGAALDAVSGAFAWTPTYEQSGSYPLTFVVSDGQYQDSASTTVTVNHVNRPPVLTEIAPQSVDENKPLQFSVAISDPDREDTGKLQLTAQNVPQGAAFDPANRSFSWTPTYEQSGSYPVTFVVSDPAGLTAQQAVTVTVNHVNRPPQLAPVAAQTVNENQPLSIQLAGSDPDTEDAGKLIFAIANLPAGAQLNAITGALNWTPNFEQSGSYTLTATVSDAAGLSAGQPLRITVNHVNRPPQFPAMSPLSVDENSPLSFSVAAADPDAEDAGKLKYAAENLPAGATLNAASGALNWTPTYEQSGQYSITVSVSDPAGASATAQLPVTVRHVNRPPTVAALPSQLLTEDREWQLELPAGQDPDAEDAGKLRYSAENLPAGASFDVNSRLIKWKPGFEQAGSYTVTYRVSDGTAATTAPLQITVQNSNRAPQLNAPGEQQIQTGQALQFRLSGSDPDAEDRDRLRYSADNLPPGAALDDQSGEFNWTPGDDQQGTYRIEFVVKDPAGLSAAQTVTIVVAGAPEPPPPPGDE